MTKSELIERLATQQSHIPAKTVEDAVKEMLEHMASTLAQGERIEIRGFGSFSLHYRAPRTGRNPSGAFFISLIWNWKLPRRVLSSFHPIVKFF